MDRPTGRRFAVVLVCLAILAGNLGQAGAQSTAEDAASTMRASGFGPFGDYSYVDSHDTPGVECDNEAGSVDITVRGLTVYANSLHASQNVRAEWDIYDISQAGAPLVTYSSAEMGASHVTPADFSSQTFFDDLVGIYRVIVVIQWLSPADVVEGSISFAFQWHAMYTNGTYKGATDACYYPTASLTPTSGTVNSTVAYSVRSVHWSAEVAVTWDGTSLGTTTADSFGHAAGSFHVPAAPMGSHTVRWSDGFLAAQRTFTVKPRIKLIPDGALRGDTVNVSLRGYASHETVRIRWKRGTSWVEIARVTTSSTGSANIDVTVPTFVPNGLTSVRGDSVNPTGGRAQTNVFKVVGGPFATSMSSSPTPTATATNTPQPPTATATATVALTDIPSPTPTTPAEIPTQEPTTVPGASPVA
jgi:hypothetical protein